VAVITHAQIRVTTANYNRLDLDDQDQFDQYMERADNAATNGEYLALMLLAAHASGIDLPYGGHIRKCACSCYCGSIFIPERHGAHVIEAGDGYNLGRHQCPLCADRHLETA
jgi:hypothetical protein